MSKCILLHKSDGLMYSVLNIAQKMKFFIKDFFSLLRIWSHLLKKSLMENFFFLCSKFFIIYIDNSLSE